MRARIDRLAGDRRRVVHALAVRLGPALERLALLRRHWGRRVVAVLFVGHRQRVVFVVVSEDEGGVFGVVVRVPAAFIEVVVLGEVVEAVEASLVVVAVEPDGVDELSEGVVGLLGGEVVSVDAVVVGVVVVVVVVVVLPLAALAPELLYAVPGLLQPARAAARATAATQGMRRFMASPDSGMRGVELQCICITYATAWACIAGAAFAPSRVFLRPRGKSFHARKRQARERRNVEQCAWPAC